AGSRCWARACVSTVSRASRREIGRSTIGSPSRPDTLATMGGPEIAAVVADHLAVYLGAHTAKVAVKTFSQRAIGRGQETLTVADLPKLFDALRPMMNTLIGRKQCESVIEKLRAELKV